MLSKTGLFVLQRAQTLFDEISYFAQYQIESLMHSETTPLLEGALWLAI